MVNTAHNPAMRPPNSRMEGRKRQRELRLYMQHGQRDAYAMVLAEASQRHIAVRHEGGLETGRTVAELIIGW